MRRLRGIAALLIAVALLGTAFGCKKVDAVARVNGEYITRGEFDRIYKQIVSQVQGNVSAADAASYKKQLMSMMVESVLITQEAEKKKADLSDKKIDAGMKELMGTATQAEFEKQIKAAGLTMEDVRKSVRDKLAREFMLKEAAKNPSSGKVNEEYVLLSHILVADENTAVKLRAQIAAGGDFAKIAEANSIDTGTKTQGGSLGWVALNQYVKTFADAAKALKDGELSQPVKSEFGWHIILKVGEVKSGTLIKDAPADLRTTLEKNSSELALQEVVAKLKKNAKIEYLDKALTPAE